MLHWPDYKRHSPEDIKAAHENKKFNLVVVGGGILLITLLDRFHEDIEKLIGLTTETNVEVVDSNNPLTTNENY